MAPVYAGIGFNCFYCYLHQFLKLYFNFTLLLCLDNFKTVVVTFVTTWNTKCYNFLSKELYSMKTIKIKQQQTKINEKLAMTKLSFIDFSEN